MAAIRELALTRQRYLDEQSTCAAELEQLKADHAARLAEVERGDLRAYTAATGAGWTPEELRKIGFSEPAKKTRTRRRPSRKPRSDAATTQSNPAAQGPGEDTDTSQG